MALEAVPEVFTTSWSNGVAGPLGFCIPESAMTAEEMRSFNVEFAGRAMVCTSGSNTHFMRGETLIEMMEQMISPALTIQRERLLSWD